MDDTFVKKTGAASIGAVLTALTVAPLEVVKTRLQVQAPDIVHVPQEVKKVRKVQAARLRYGLSRCFCNQSSHYCFSNGLMDTMLPKERLLKTCRCKAEELCSPSNSTSLLRTMARIVRLEGPLALYAGLAPTLVIAVPSTAMYFTSYEAFLRRLREAFPNQSVGPMAMVSGAMARAGAATVFSPLEVIRVQMQASTASESFVQHLRRVVGAGPRQLCAGLGATLARDIPFSAMYWYGIETSKPVLDSMFTMENPSRKKVTVALIAGIVAGTFATVATHPFDVVKTRAQVAIYSTSASTHHVDGRPMSSLQMLQRIWVNEGLRGVTSGLSPRIAKVAPACAIMISSYEAAKIAFKLPQ